MTSFIQTMLVDSFSSSPSFPRSPKPLAPVQSLEQSTSCSHMATISDATIAGNHHKRKRSSESVVVPLRKCLHDMTPPSQRGSRQSSPTATSSVASPKSSHSLELAKSTLIISSPLRLPPRLKARDHSTCADPTQDNATSQQKQERLIDVLYRNSRARAPFRPQKASKGTSSWQLRQFAEATLGSGSLRKAVKLPEGEDVNEWFAVNVVDFYNQINLLYGSITEFCSPVSCPEMKATDEFEYLWQDSENFKRPTKMSAPEYIEHLMAWCQTNIDNEQMFPSRIGVPFPKPFPTLLRTMFKRLYRVYAHIYCHHYPVIIQLGLEPHLNTSFKHYVLFVDEHQLATGKDFWGPLGDLVESMLRSD